MKSHKIALLIYLFIFIIPLSLSGQFRSEYINIESHYEIKGYKLTEKTRAVLQINERVGDEDTNIGLYYKKGDKVNIGAVWIEDMSGNIIRKLDKKEIKDRNLLSNSSFYSDELIKSFEIKHTTYPYRVVYSYERTLSRFLGIDLSFHNKSRQPVRHGKLIVKTPREEPIKYSYKNTDSFNTDTIPDAIKYMWEYSYTPTLFTEVNASVNTTKAPRIDIVPLLFKYGVEGSYENWATFGNYIYRLNKGRDVLTNAEKEKIDNLLAGIDDDREKAKALYYYLQDNTRYINVNIKVGGLQTYPAEYVCINKYGDCKALSNYMMALLKHAGISSHYTLVRSDQRIYDVDDDFPSQEFNHVIVTLPIKGDTIYLECTSKNTPFGYVHTSIQGRKALMVNENNSHLITLPSMYPDDVINSRNFYLELNTMSSANVKMIANEKGRNYEFSNFLNTDINKNEVDRYIRNSIFEGSYDVLDYKLSDHHRDEAVISTEVSCKMHNIIKKYGNNIVLSPFPIHLPAYESPEKRTQDIQIDYPQFNTDTIIYEIQDMNITKIPEDIFIDTTYGYYKLSFKIEENQLVINKSMLLRAGRYSLEEYKDFYTFIMKIKNIENTNQYIEVL